MSGYTKEDVLRELVELYGAEERQPGDVDKYDIAQALDIDPSTAFKKMRGLVKRGLYTEHTVMGKAGKRLIVWRKK